MHWLIQGLADCYTYNQKGLSQVEAMPIARDYTAKALSIDSTLPEAWTTWLLFNPTMIMIGRKPKSFLEGSSLKTPIIATAHIYYGNILQFQGNFDEGIAETRKALRIDPLSAVINYVLGRSFYFARKYDSAIAQLQKTVTLESEFPNAYIPYGQTLAIQKKYSEAIEIFSRLPEGVFDLGSNKYLFQSYVYAMQGDLTKSKQLLEKVPEPDRSTLRQHNGLYKCSDGIIMRRR